jgi:hypothetical protein
MRRPIISAVLLFSVLVVSPPRSAFAQEKPLTRTFVRGSEEHYQLSVAIRVETHGISTERIGEKTYATPYAHVAEGQLSWRATRQVMAVKDEGRAGIRESLDQFRLSCDSSSDSTPADLQKSVRETCAGWQTPSLMNYEEDTFGLIRGLPQGVSELIGPDSPLLSLWLRRAFRPSVILPKAPLHFGDHASHRISNSSGDIANPEGEESVEWLEAPSDTPAATLHVSQNLSWIDPPKKKTVSDSTGKPNIRQLFYADSLNTISLLDGSLIKASRSATCETKELLDPVPGLPDAPEFGSKLTVTVTMRRLP